MTMKFEELKKDFTKEKLNELEIKTYLPLAEKMGIVDGVMDSLIINEDGYFVLDIYKKELLLTYILFAYYAQIEFEEDENGIIQFDDEEYDWIIENSVYDFITTKIDYNFFDIFYRKIEQELEKRNSISAVLNRLGNKLINKLDELGDEEKLQGMMNLADEALVRFPFIADIVKSDLMPMKQVKKSGVKKKVK